VSIDGGARWVKMNNNMPNVPVKDLLVHPRDNDLVIGSYGRDLWTANIAPLQELDESVLAKDVHFFNIAPTIQRVPWQFAANDYLFGQRHLQTPNETNGMIIRYYLKKDVAAKPSVVVTDANGREVARLQGAGGAGINSVVWTMRAQTAGGGRGGGRGVNVMEQLAPLGEYTVTLEAFAFSLPTSQSDVGCGTRASRRRRRAARPRSPRAARQGRDAAVLVTACPPQSSRRAPSAAS
jgi:hypothetical protein